MSVQTDDLARMYRLFQRIPKGLDPIAEIFKEHVEGEGMKLVKDVAEAVEAKKERDAGGDMILPFVLVHTVSVCQYLLWTHTSTYDGPECVAVSIIICVVLSS